MGEGTRAQHVKLILKFLYIYTNQLLHPLSLWGRAREGENTRRTHQLAILPFNFPIMPELLHISKFRPISDPLI